MENHTNDDLLALEALSKEVQKEKRNQRDRANYNPEKRALKHQKLYNPEQRSLKHKKSYKPTKRNPSYNIDLKARAEARKAKWEE